MGHGECHLGEQPRARPAVQGLLLQGFSATTAEGIEKYLGSGMIRGIGFRTADAIAARLGIEATAMIRLRAGIIDVPLEARGDLYLHLDASR